MRLLKYLLYLLPLILFVIITTSRELQREELGSRSNPIRFYFTPSVDAQEITSSAKELMDYLEAETGYYFTSGVPTSYVAVVEAFGSAKSDIAIINTFSYLLANQKYGAEARLRLVRDQGETTYRGQIIARVDSDIDSLADIDGKKMAFVDPSSTSGYILPKSLLDEAGIVPSEIVFGSKHDNVVTMVYQEQVDAGATYYSPPDTVTGELYDARARVLTQFPDVGEKIKIIAFTEKIPNDPVVFRKEMPDEMKDAIVDALLKFVATNEGQEALHKIYNVKGLVPTTDEDYDVLRNMLKKINFELEKHVK